MLSSVVKMLFFKEDPPSVTESCAAVDELIAYEKKLNAPFSKEELAELFKKKDTLAPLGFFEGIQCADQSFETEAQEVVDEHISRLNNYKTLHRKLNSPFSEEELTVLFQKHSWGSRRGSLDYDLLTAEEKYFVDKSGWTPSKSIHENKSNLSVEERRQEMKLSVFEESKDDAWLCDTMKLLVMKYEKDHEIYYFFDLHPTSQFSVSRQNLSKLKKVIPDLTDVRIGALWFAVLNHCTAVCQRELRQDQRNYLECKYQETLELLNTCKFKIFDDEYFDCPSSYSDNYQLLTDCEKLRLQQLGLTPRRRNPEMKHECVSTMRRYLKQEVVEPPDFLCRHPEYKVRYEDGFYFVEEKNLSVLSLIVEKEKLRPDQIEFMEQQCKMQEVSDENRVTVKGMLDYHNRCACSRACANAKPEDFLEPDEKMPNKEVK